MRKRPMLMLACVFLLGICQTKIGNIVVAAAVLLWGYACLPLFQKKKWRRLAIRSSALLAVFVVGILHMQAACDFRQRYLGKIEDGEVVTVQGEIYKKEFKNEQYTYFLRDCYIALSKENVACNNVTASFPSDDYPINKILMIQGKVNLFSEATNEGEFDMRAFYRSRKIDFGLRDARVLEQHGRDDSVAEKLYRMRKRLSQVPGKLMGEENAGVLSGMLLGEKDKLGSEIKSEYENAGISHILAISALHMSVFAMGAYRLLRRGGMGFAGAAACSALFVEGYATLTGNSVSTQRAAAMFIIMTLAAVAARSYDMLNALGCWMILALWENPFLYCYSGFVFSVTAVLGIGFTVHTIGDEDNKLIRNLISGVGIQITTMPIVAFYYYELPTYAVLLNILVLPLLAVVLLSGACGTVAGLYCFGLGKLLIIPADIILSFYRWLCRLALGLPCSQVIVGKPSMAKLLAYYLILGIIIYLYGMRKRGFGKKHLAAGFLVLLLLLYHRPSVGEEIDMLDVGQGDAVFLSTSDHVSFFIDGGSTSVSHVGAYRILPFLKSRGIGGIEGWFISHADEDHINGVREVLSEGYPIRFLVLAEAMPRDEAYEQLVRAAKQNGTKIVYMDQGDRIGTESAEFLCVFPKTSKDDDAKTTAADSPDRNSYSLTLLYRSARMSCLFPGDISADEEGKLPECTFTEEVDVYKAAHHGSKHSSSAEYLLRLSPQISLISCGAGNSYGHPGEEAIANIRAAGSRIYNTALHGQIKLTPEAPHEITVRTAK